MKKKPTNNLVQIKLNQQLPQAKQGQRANAETKKKKKNINKCE